MTLRRDPITGDLRLFAPGRSARLAARSGCPFCPGREEDTPPETGRVEARHADAGLPGAVDSSWSARSFPNRFPLTDRHEVLVPSPRHVTSWRELVLPELHAALELLVRRRASLREPGRYVHAFVNDGSAAGASMSHVHAQLVSVPDGEHARRLTAGLQGADCALCAVLRDPEAAWVVERGRHCAIVAHPVPRIAGALLVVPLEHEARIAEPPVEEFAAFVHRALQAVDGDAALNMWFVADEEHDAHWYLEVQPRTAGIAGVELALGISVVGRDPQEVAVEARERLAQHG